MYKYITVHLLITITDMSEDVFFMGNVIRILSIFNISWN